MKEYKSEEKIFFLLGVHYLEFIIGFSAISHKDEETPYFAEYKAYCRTKRSDKYELFYTGDIRWDGTMTIKPEFTSYVYDKLDDLTMTSYLPYAIFASAWKHIFHKKLDDKDLNYSTEYVHLANLFKSYLVYNGVFIDYDDYSENPWFVILRPDWCSFCKTFKKDLIEMSAKIISNKTKNDD